MNINEILKRCSVSLSNQDRTIKRLNRLKEIGAEEIRKDLFGEFGLGHTITLEDVQYQDDCFFYFGFDYLKNALLHEAKLETGMKNYETLDANTCFYGRFK